MGVYDRDYMSGTDEALHAGGRRYTAVLALVALNAVVWAAWQFGRTQPALCAFMDWHFTVGVEGVFQDLRLHTLLTNCLSHEGLWHIVFNMLFLWILGDDVERIYGFRNFVWLYAVTGVMASLAFVGVEALRGAGGSALGASGAVMGIALVAAIFDPRKPISVWGLVTVPLRLLVVIYIAIDILSALDGRDLIAHTAHLGGAAAGYVFWRVDLRLFASPGRSHVGLLYRLRRWLRRKPGLRVVEKVPEELPPEAVALPARAAQAAQAAGGSEALGGGRRVDAVTRERVDALLSKIARQGLGALTEEERAFLKESSRRYRGE